MHSRLSIQVRKVLLGSVLGGIALFHCSGASGSTPTPVERTTVTSGKHFTVNTVTFSDGKVIDEAIINGPPTPPPGFEAERQAVSLPVPDSAAGMIAGVIAGAIPGTKVITGVPAFNWVFGCSAVSGAMIAGYYDRLGFSNMYTGPTNGGLMPLDNSSWPTWSDGSKTYPNCPLIASKKGVDGRTTRGSIDDYWVQYNSAAPDPYITNGWTQHAWGSAIGDYMMTSQSAFGNTDGSTTFWNWTSSPNHLTCDDMESNSLDDGTLGRKKFFEARGYTVADCYNQKTDNKIAGGFSFANFKAEIDAGNPVMLNLAGHTIVGVGYNLPNTVYIHDTWDYNNHTMTWGTSYSGMELLSVSIVHLVPPPPKISVSPMSINFGAQKLGVPSSQKYVTIKNSGAAASKLAVGVMAITGDSDFILSSQCPDPLAMGDYCSPSVTLIPSSFGNKSATLSIPSNDPKKPAVLVKLAATVIPPTISVSPSSLNFGNVKIGPNSATRVVTIKNTGLSDLILNSFTLSGDINPSLPSYTCSGAPMAKDVSCTVYVAISPASAGPKAGEFKISSNDPKKPSVSVSLKGTAMPPSISVSAAKINFGSVVVANSVKKAITIKNNGLSDLIITSVALEGGTSFAQTNSCGGVIAKGGTCLVNVTFAPVSTGSISDTIDIASNDPVRPTLKVSLSGKGK